MSDAEASVTSVWQVQRYNDGLWSEAEDEIASESPLTIRLDGEEFATIVCSHADWNDLIYGFLASEGAIRFADDILAISIDEDTGFADVTLKRRMSSMHGYHSKRVIGSCCGKSRQFYFHTDAQTAKTIMTREPIAASRVLAVMEQLQQSSAVFQRTAGVHNAALFDQTDLIAVRTDIGRHNALDKLYGFILQRKLRMSGKVLAFSGRISSEVVIKTAKMGCGILLSKSAPTDLGLSLADDLGITVIGFIRGNRFTVYTHPERVLARSKGEQADGH